MITSTASGCCWQSAGTWRAGVTGLLLAAAAVQEGARALIAHLRMLNPYVAAARGATVLGRSAMHLPRQAGGRAALPPWHDRNQPYKDTRRFALPKGMKK